MLGKSIPGETERTWDAFFTNYVVFFADSAKNICDLLYLIT